MKYILMIVIMVVLAGCNDGNDTGEVIGVGNDSGGNPAQNESADEGESEDEFIVEESKEDETEEEVELEAVADDFNISNLEPNAVAELVNEREFEVVTESEKDFYEQITDIDGSGEKETVQILKNTDINDDSVQFGQYILAIFDETGTARYAEYTYDFFSSTPPRILDIADLDGDGISEIILENLPASNATAAAGFKSLSRFIYKYDDSIGQFTNVSNLGRFLRNEAVADYDVYINDFITGLGYTFSYEEAVKNPENEGHLNDLIDFGIIDEIEEGLADDFVEKTHGVQRYQYVSALENIEDGTTGVIYEDPVYPMR